MCDMFDLNVNICNFFSFICSKSYSSKDFQIIYLIILIKIEITFLKVKFEGQLNNST